MNSILSLTVFVTFTIVLAQSEQLDKNFGVGEIKTRIQDKKFVEKQLGCVLGKADCDTLGNQLKVAIPEVLVKGCKDCTPEQSANANRLIAFIKMNYPAEWSQIAAKYGVKGDAVKRPRRHIRR